MKRLYSIRDSSLLRLEFENDEARRAYFTEELRKKLNDPEFKEIEGFPIGEDEDILRLSDPPYYTACPNPWIPDFIEEWEKRNQRSQLIFIIIENLLLQMCEGKMIRSIMLYPIIQRFRIRLLCYILHYTEPGDIVFDGFAGTADGSRRSDVR